MSAKKIELAQRIISAKEIESNYFNVRHRFQYMKSVLKDIDVYHKSLSWNTLELSRPNERNNEYKLAFTNLAICTPAHIFSTIRIDYPLCYADTIREKIEELHTRYCDTGDRSLLYIIHIHIKNLKGEIIRELTQTKKLLRQVIAKLKFYAFVRDIRRTIMRVTLKHYKKPSDVSGSDINMLNNHLLNNINNHKNTFYERNKVSFYLYAEQHYKQPGSTSNYN